MRKLRPRRRICVNLNQIDSKGDGSERGGAAALLRGHYQNGYITHDLDRAMELVWGSDEICAYEGWPADKPLL